jgi:hypothetical protein
MSLWVSEVALLGHKRRGDAIRECDTRLSVQVASWALLLLSVVPSSLFRCFLFSCARG